MATFKLSDMQYHRGPITLSQLQAIQPVTAEERETVDRAIDAVQLTHRIVTLARLGVTSPSRRLDVLAPDIASRKSYLDNERTRSAIPRDVTDPQNIWFSPLVSAQRTSKRIVKVALTTTGAAAVGAFIYQKPVLIALTSVLAITLPLMLLTVHSVMTKRALKEEAKRFALRGSGAARSRQVCDQISLLARATRPLVQAPLFGPTHGRGYSAHSFDV